MTLYANLEISLRRADDRSYAVGLSFSHPGSDAEVEPMLGAAPVATFDLARLHELALDPIAYGAELSARLFADRRLLAAFSKARGSAQQAETPLRLRLSIGLDAPELHALRWETLHDPDDGTTLSTSDHVLFARYLGSADWRPVRLRPRGQLSALAVVASPTDLARLQLAPIDAAAELARARQGLGSLPVTALYGGGATLAGVTAALSAASYDILYLVAHGMIRDGEPYLCLEDATGAAQFVPGSDLMRLLREIRSAPRLAALVSCQSAGSSSDEALAALGPRLIAAGVPAVLAMQGNFSMQTAAQFLPAFFRELQRDGQIDRALATARRAVRERPDAWMPTLFTRLKSGQLWYVPGFADDQQGFRKWPALLNSITKGRCTPILGSGLLEPLLGSTREIAQEWAQAYAFPLEPHEREDLPQVTQYLAVNQDAQFPRDKLAEYLHSQIMRRYGQQLPAELRDAGPEQLDALFAAAGSALREADLAEPHRVLAGLPFPIYITTNPDNLIETALAAGRKTPHTTICPWNEYVARSVESYDDQPDDQQPLVYHLFGRLDQPESLVLTEDDYFDFLIGVTRNNHLIPDVVRDALADTALLFLGFQLDDWNFRVLFRSLMSQEGRSRRSRYAHVAVQINPEEGRILEPERARQYLESYFEDAQISIYWGTVEDFMRQLVEKLGATP